MKYAGFTLRAKKNFSRFTKASKLLMCKLKFIFVKQNFHQKDFEQENVQQQVKWPNEISEIEFIPH